MTAARLREWMPYGAPELRDAARPHMVRALALSNLLAGLVFALAWVSSLLLVQTAGPPVTPVPTAHYVDLIDHMVLPPPPAIAPAPIAPAGPVKAAIPVPVPDALAPPAGTAPSQADLASIIGPGANTAPPGEAPVDTEEGPVNQPGAFPSVDELPIPITAVEPVYPELARQAQVEGLVMVNVLVGKDGRVLDARADPKANVLLLNEAALEAARRWVFTPALANNRPVTVWVNIPFRFRLRN